MKKCQFEYNVSNLSPSGYFAFKKDFTQNVFKLTFFHSVQPKFRCCFFQHHR